jgi:hypothetical protein
MKDVQIIIKKCAPVVMQSFLWKKSVMRRLVVDAKNFMSRRGGLLFCAALCWQEDKSSSQRKKKAHVNDANQETNDVVTLRKNPKLAKCQQLLKEVVNWLMRRKQTR